jgi:hypothetical protein
VLARGHLLDVVVCKGVDQVRARHTVAHQATKLPTQPELC